MIFLSELRVVLPLIVLPLKTPAKFWKIWEVLPEIMFWEVGWPIPESSMRTLLVAIAFLFEIVTLKVKYHYLANVSAPKKKKKQKIPQFAADTLLAPPPPGNPPPPGIFNQKNPPPLAP